MRNAWTYEENLRSTEASMIGYDVEALDGEIGKVDAESREADAEHLVVDTGFWIFGKKRLIPAGVVSAIDHDDERVHVNMTKEQIENAPDWDDDSVFDHTTRATQSTYYLAFMYGGRPV